MPAKTIIITGCGPSSIGAALATEFRLLGHTVFATGLSLSPSDIDPSLCSLGCHALPLDVTSLPSIALVERTITAAIPPSQGLDILIHSAGVLGPTLPLADTPVDHARSVFEVDELGIWAVTRAFLPLLVQNRGGSAGNAVVATLGSINGRLCPPFFGAYSARKAAVEALTRTLRRELAPLGVRVVELRTGAVGGTGLLGSEGKVRLPDGSWYEALRAFIEERRVMRVAWWERRDTYARAVVRELSKERPRAVFWKGGMARVVRLLGWLGFETMLDWIMIKGVGLDRARVSSHRDEDDKFSRRYESFLTGLEDG